MFEDLVLHGMMRSYTTWSRHGERPSSTVASSIRLHNASEEVGDNNDEELGDDIVGMLRAACGVPVCDGEDMDSMAGEERRFQGDS